jgi:hypothetical protein
MPFKKAAYHLLCMAKEGVISLADEAKELLQQFAKCDYEQYEALCLKIETLPWVFEDELGCWAMFRQGGGVWIKWVNEPE